MTFGSGGAQLFKMLWILIGVAAAIAAYFSLPSEKTAIAVLKFDFSEIDDNDALELEFSGPGVSKGPVGMPSPVA